MIVVDANILSFYLITGERTVDANALRNLDAEWVVPTFWRVEVQSILWKYVRFAGMPAARALPLLDHALDLFSVNEVAPSPDGVLRDALLWGITVYDAQYVSLARQLGMVCVTEDGPVQAACPGLAVSLDAFLKGRPPSGAVKEARASYRPRRRGASSGGHR